MNSLSEDEPFEDNDCAQSDKSEVDNYYENFYN